MEKMHTNVVRKTFSSQMYKTHYSRTGFTNADAEKLHATVVRQAFFKSTCTKHTMLGPLLDKQLYAAVARNTLGHGEKIYLMISKKMEYSHIYLIVLIFKSIFWHFSNKSLGAPGSRFGQALTPSPALGTFCWEDNTAAESRLGAGVGTGAGGTGSSP